jgi:hypothetical protein
MNPLFRLFAVGSLLAASLSYAADAFEGKVSLALTMPKGKTQNLDYSMKGQSLRIDIAAEGQTFSSIMDLAKQEMLVVMPEQKMYMILPIKQHIDKAVAQHPQNDQNVEKTGRTETILGYKCDEYVSTDKDGSKTEVWVAEGLGSFMGLGNSGGGGMGGMFGGGKKAAAPGGWEEKFKGKAGFPLRVVSRNAKSAETFRMEATKIEPGTLSASLFQPPAGYQKFQMPDFGGMMKGLPGQ